MALIRLETEATVNVATYLSSGSVQVGDTALLGLVESADDLAGEQLAAAPVGSMAVCKDGKLYIKWPDGWQAWGVSS